MDDKLKDIFDEQQKITEEDEKGEDFIQLVGFIVNDEEFAFPILNIQEIIKPLAYTRVPRVPDYIFGVFNLRGNVIPLVNLSLKFGNKLNKPNKDNRYIVVINGQDLIGFLVDRLTKAIRLREADISPSNEHTNDKNSILYGIGKKDDGIVTILQPNNILLELNK